MTETPDLRLLVALYANPALARTVKRRMRRVAKAYRYWLGTPIQSTEEYKAHIMLMSARDDLHMFYETVFGKPLTRRRFMEAWKPVADALGLPGIGL